MRAPMIDEMEHKLVGMSVLITVIVVVLILCYLAPIVISIFLNPKFLLLYIPASIIAIPATALLENTVYDMEKEVKSKNEIDDKSC